MSTLTPSSLGRRATAAAATPQAPATTKQRGVAWRGRRGLSRKFALAFTGLVSLVLIVNGGIDMWLGYDEAKSAAARIQLEKARAAAERIEAFVGDIEQEIGWTTNVQWSDGTVDQRRYDFMRLLRQVPAITDLTEIDGTGREQLYVSRLAIDVVGSGADYSADPRFQKAVADRVWFGPVYFRKESEPYMTISVAHVGVKPGVTAADVNLKFIWDVVTALRVGQAGHAYVVDSQGRLIAHPDISLVLRDTDLSQLPQVAGALAALRDAAIPDEDVAVARGPEGRSVLSAYAPIARLNWLVFVELPLREALAPVYASLARTSASLALGLLLAAVAGTLLARRMMVPIRQLQSGAELLGSGALDHRIEIRTGDEIEALADRFNRMGAQLQDSYETLEAKVEARTRDLAEALQFQTATSEVLHTVASAAEDLQPVFDGMLERATALCEAKFGLLFLYDGDAFTLAATRNVPPALAEALGVGPLRVGPNTTLARLVHTKRPCHLVDLRHDVAYIERDPTAVAVVELGDASVQLTVPLLKKGEVVGAFAIYRQEKQPFSRNQMALVTTFADQAVIAIENARLLGELRQRTTDLARSVEELTTLREVGQAVGSTLDLATVLQTIITRAVALAGADAGAIYRYRKSDRRFRLGTSHGFGEELTAKIHGLTIRDEETTALARAVRERTPVQIPDLDDAPHLPLRDVTAAAGFRSALIVPLVGADRVFGALVIRKKTLGEFPEDTVKLMQTFASQSVLAIQNARLFREVEEQGIALALASQHKSQFVANMSHELRTPLNAVLGYAELLVDGIYGELPEKARDVLERIQSNGRHLLRLINDVLDLSKIEAGQLVLTIDDYSMTAIAESVVASTESLVRAKGLEFGARIADGMPLGRGDERRLTQVLLNLVGNAIKFTDKGSVELVAIATQHTFDVSVRDTGPGIAVEDHERIFEEFHQIDNTTTRTKGGTGLGLAIARRIAEMHNGRLTVESVLGAGSTFRLVVPVRVEEHKEAAQ
jgi:signal transduction histidine kinase